MGIFDKAKEALGGEDLTDKGIEKAGDLVDDKTGDKYSGQIDQAQKLADDRLGDTTGSGNTGL